MREFHQLWGCRSGSIRTSEHISVKRFAVRSLISLWRMDGKPPLGQVRECSIENLAPQPHVAGQFCGCGARFSIDHKNAHA